MSREVFDDNCPGCRPAILDIQTGKVLPNDDPLMVKMLGVWAETTFSERQAYHRVMCLNSRDPLDLFLVRGIVERLEGEGKVGGRS
jgi:hypothetical protein